MFRSLEIENFRRFKRYEMHGLGRVNLLVGTNNSGKTSILEAVQILASRDDPLPVYEALARRGERVYEAEDGTAPRASRSADVCRLFHGHDLELSSSFSIRGQGASDRSMSATIGPWPGNPRGEELLLEAGSTGLGLALRWNGDIEERRFLPISNHGGIVQPRISAGASSLRGGSRFAKDAEGPGVYFVESSSLAVDEVVRLFDAVSLNPEEARVIQSLQLIEPDIEKIASMTERGSNGARGGFVVRCKGQAKRVPIGSLGDGIWRMLGLTLTLIRSADGCLLVDEIDTGLHYTVLKDVWRLVAGVARQLNVQVFATTHSSDCWTSLAAVARETRADDVSIQRIEPDLPTAVAFSAEEMVLAAERGIEVR